MAFLPWLKVLLYSPVILYHIFKALVKSLMPKTYRYKKLDGETILITGAGSGIGREFAKKLSNFDVKLVLIDVNLTGLNETADAIQNTRVFVFECDLCDRQQIYEVANRIREQVGIVTMLVNNAGIVNGKKFLECPDHLIQRTMDVNIMAHFWTCKAFLPDMISANHGHIVNVASAVGFLSVSSNLVDYTASKFAVTGFSEALRCELLHDKISAIKITTVAPGFVTSGLFEGVQTYFPARSPKDVAEEIVSAIRLNKETVFIPSFLSLVIGVYRLLPNSSQKGLNRIAGGLSIMDKWRGRGNPESPVIINDAERNTP